MYKEQLIGSFLIRFSEKQNTRYIKMQNLRTGEQLEFETWVAAWAFLEDALAEKSLEPLATGLITCKGETKFP